MGGGRLSGNTVGVSPTAILCNGPSLEDHAKAGHLKHIPCETIGVNRSWEVARSSYHVMIDPAQWEDYRRITGHSAGEIPNLYTGQNGPDGATKLNILDTIEPRFSFYPVEMGAWLCGSVTWVALQLAVWMRRNPIYFFGLDLQPRGCKGKFWGGTWDPHSEARQRELFGYARGLLGPSGIEMVNVVMIPEHSKCQAFPKKRFGEAFPSRAVSERTHEQHSLDL